MTASDASQAKGPGHELHGKGEEKGKGKGVDCSVITYLDASLSDAECFGCPAPQEWRA